MSAVSAFHGEHQDAITNILIGTGAAAAAIGGGVWGVRFLKNRGSAEPILDQTFTSKSLPDLGRDPKRYADIVGMAMAQRAMNTETSPSDFQRYSQQEPSTEELEAQKAAEDELEALKAAEDFVNPTLGAVAAYGTTKAVKFHNRLVTRQKSTHEKMQTRHVDDDIQFYASIGLWAHEEMNDAQVPCRTETDEITTPSRDELQTIAGSTGAQEDKTAPPSDPPYDPPSDPPSDSPSNPPSDPLSEPGTPPEPPRVRFAGVESQTKLFLFNDRPISINPEGQKPLRKTCLRPIIRS